MSTVDLITRSQIMPIIGQYNTDLIILDKEYYFTSDSDIALIKESYP
jgi:hypothetical protein